MKQSNVFDNSSQRNKRARWLSTSLAAGESNTTVARYNDKFSSSQDLHPTITPPTNNEACNGNTKMSPTASSSLQIQSTSEREIQAYKEESLRNKNQLRLERVKWEQTESRLRRQIKFLMEESESNRLTLEEDREKNEVELERVTRDRNQILSSLREAELKIASGLHVDNGDFSHEAMLYQRKNEILEEKVEMLEDDMMQLNTELSTREERVHELELSLADLKESSPKKEIPFSNAPPAVLSELNRTRVTLSETQRKLRVQTQKVEGLQKELSTQLPIKEISDVLKSKNTKLEQENAALLKENLLAKNSKTAWESFYRQLKSAFPDLVPPETLTSPSKLSKSIPPEVSSILRHFQALQSSLSGLEQSHASITQQCNISKENITDLQSSLASSKAEVQSLQTKTKDYQDQIKTLSITNRKLQCCEKIHKREVESMQYLLKQTSTDDQKSAIQALQLSRSSLVQELETNKTSYQALEEELSTKFIEFTKLQEEYDTILHKFGLLKDALMTEREKASKAEDRANQAESLAGKGSYNTNTTRVLHLQNNPLIESLKRKYETQIENLMAERNDALQESRESSFFTSPDNSMEKKSIADAQKFNQRLKENFKEQIAIFREGVYLLTGLKIDMFDATEQPTFKLRSVYAEREDDHLLFIWPEKYKKGTSVTSLDLLSSDYAEEACKTDSFMYMTNFKSIPSFLASLTLKLFEIQTMA